MTRSNNHDHPDLETLLAYCEKRIPPLEATAVEKHLTECLRCRLEINHFHRFNDLDKKAGTELDDQWAQAEFALEKSWRDNIHPQVAANILRSQKKRSHWLVWLLPAAAAAVAALIFLGPALSPESLSPLEVTQVTRGASDDQSTTINLLSPSGQLKHPPQRFTWKTRTDCDHFTLEIFTSDLNSLLVETDLDTTFWIPTTEAKNRLQPETIYLWKVRGYSELKPVADSENNWFRFPPAK